MIDTTHDFEEIAMTEKSDNETVKDMARGIYLINFVQLKDELREHILYGVRLSIIKLLEKCRKDNNKLVIGADGQIKHVTADEYIALFPNTTKLPPISEALQSEINARK